MNLYEEVIARYPNSDCSISKQVYEKIKEEVGDNWSRAASLTKSDLSRIFLAYNMGRLKWSFVKAKTFLMRLYELLEEKGLSTAAKTQDVETFSYEDVDSKEMIARLYYRDTADMIQKLNQEAIRQNYRYHSAFLGVRTSAILMWKGIPMGNLGGIQKNDIHSEDSAVVYEGHKYPLTDIELDALLEYAGMDHFLADADRRIRFVSSPCLFRTKAADHLSYRSIQRFFTWINDKFENQKIYPKRVVVNAQFEKIHQVEGEYQSISDAVRAVTGAKDKTKVQLMKSDYLKWREVYFE